MRVRFSKSGILRSSPEFSGIQPIHKTTSFYIIVQHRCIKSFSALKKLNFGDHYEGFCQPTQTSPLRLQIDSNVRFCVFSQNDKKIFRLFKFPESLQLDAVALLVIVANLFKIKI